MILALALVPAAFPCAGFVTTDAAAILASSDAQQAILSRESDTVASASYRASFQGDAEDFAWIIPVPGPVLAVEEGDEQIFKLLDAATAPTWEQSLPEEDAGFTGFGCGGASKGGDSLGANAVQERAGVEIVAEGFAGDFQYTVLEADQADGLVGWLTDHGYDTSVSAPAIARYVDDPTIAYRWVAVQLRPDAAQVGEDLVLTPLTVRWGTDEGQPLVVSYPSRMASTSMLDEVRTTLFVTGMGTPSLTNDWTVAESSVPSRDGWGDYDVVAGSAEEEPAELFTTLLRENGGVARTYWRTWAGTPSDVTDFGGTGLVDPGFVTRFDGIHAPSSQITDVTFVAGDQVGDRTILFLPAEEVSTDAAFALPLGLLGLAWRRRRAVTKA